ncbi:MAG: S24/S26 family peptidase [Deltaproteobacteria bacterium]|nr:S24/S26 family peptidase [Deltaproteobacteria bacterium]
MKPTIVQGAIIVLDLDDTEYADRKIFVVRTADMIATVKRVRK